MTLTPRGFSSTLSVGQIIFQVLRLNDEMDRPSAMRAGHDLDLLPIWPISKDGVVWPPATYHTDETIEQFAARWIWT